MKAKCKKCNYEWEYKGNMMMATCPSCASKVYVQTKEVVK